MNIAVLFINYFLSQYHFNLDKLNNIFASNFFIFISCTDALTVVCSLFQPPMVILRKSQIFFWSKRCGESLIEPTNMPCSYNDRITGDLDNSFSSGE